MSANRRLYFDNAATSWPKPEGVYAAVDQYQRTVGVSLGRGASRAAVELQSVVRRCRARVARLFSAERAEQILWTFNGTDSLNQAIHGLLKPGDHVIASAAEHNSVLRPLRAAVDRLGVSVSYLPVDGQGIVNPEDLAAAIGPDTALVALTHASNVTGAIQPVAEIGAIVRETAAVFLVDAAQTAGHLPIDLTSLPVDLLACSGHKGLLGPLGTGLLYVRPGIEQRLRPQRQGGTGSQSESDVQPLELPEGYESGNLNVPGLVGLEAALAWIEARTIAAIKTHEDELIRQLVEGLQSQSGVTVHGPRAGGQRVGVVSVSIAGLPPQDAAAILDQNFQIETRAGLHCAPRMHQALGTEGCGGTLRLSVGPFTTTADVAAVLDAIAALAGSAAGG